MLDDEWLTRGGKNYLELYKPRELPKPNQNILEELEETDNESDFSSGNSFDNKEGIIDDFLDDLESSLDGSDTGEGANVNGNGYASLFRS